MNWLKPSSIPVDALERKRQINLLAWSLIGLMILGALLTVMPFVLEPVNYRADDPVNVISAMTMAVLLFAYWQNRRGNYVFAAYLTLTIIVVAILVATTTNPPDSYDILNYMIIPVLFASILLPLRANVMLVAGSIVLMLIIAATGETDGMFTVPVLFFSTVALLTLLIMRNRDLVEQDRQSTLAESEERFRKIFVEAPMGMAIIDKDKRFVRVNMHLCAMLGYSVQELQAMNLSHVFHPEDSHNETTANTQRPVIITEHRCVTKDGTVLWVTLTASLIREKSVGYGLLMIENITRRKQMEAQAREAERLLHELAKQREMTDFQSEFLTLVSHEFRTPLTAILSSSELLERYHERLAPDARAEGLRRINAEVIRLNQMVDDLLEMSRGESGQIKFTPQPLNLLQFCQTLVKDMAVGHTHTLTFTHFGDLTNIPADLNLLRPVLTNLIANAIKYTPSGGHIQVEARLKDEQVLISVTDEGIGIPEADQQRIFEPFYRGANVGKIKGTGLGLRIVRDYVNLHGGNITFTSEPGKGTTFTVSLPVVLAVI